MKQKRRSFLYKIRSVLSCIRLYLCNHFIANIPFHCVRLGYYRFVMGFEIGNKSYVLLGTTFDSTSNLTIGTHSVINTSCRLDTRNQITIGNNVSISANVIILTEDHDPNSDSFETRKRPVSIGDNVFIGTRTIILPGVTVSEGAVIGAGSVVTRSVPAFTIVAGVPAATIALRRCTIDYEIDYHPFLG